MSDVDDEWDEFKLPLPDAPVDPEPSPRRPTTMSFGAIQPPPPVDSSPSPDTFERDLERWIRDSGKLFYIELTEFQLTRLLHHAAVFHRKHGGR